MSGISKRIIIIGMILLVFIALFFYYILPISIPLIIAIITALMLEPLVKLVQYKLKLKRQLSIIIVFTLFTLILAFAIFFIITKAISQGIKLVEEAPGYIQELAVMWNHYEEYFSNAARDFPEEIVTAITDEVNNFLGSFITSLKEHFKIENISAFLSYIPNYLVSFLVYLIALFMFMIDLPKLRAGIYKYMTDKTSEKVKFMTSRLSSVFFGFFKAQFLVSLIIMVAAFIGLILIAPKVAIIMTLIIWIIDLIPIIGSIVILAPWSLYHFFTGDIAFGSKLAILAVILLVIRRTVEPKVMGQHMGLSPLATLISMFLGLKLVGVLGLIIGPTILIVFKSAKEAGLIKLNFKI
ncbi:sporulation integral membrane protein YtvI [Bacillus sp. FJAT-49711]|uniref:sporulation integral membrane protein YtvI n=1 Tax=Bacillus sp. FJAT-49711 TaxID=2833585 RepID=UPI002016A222|nr:sporulation integral membrane protein YtvI [Bacillus sp. FJAT-49711]